MPLTDRQQLIKDIFIAYINNFQKFNWEKQTVMARAIERADVILGQIEVKENNSAPEKRIATPTSTDEV